MLPENNHSTESTASVNNPVDDIAALLAGDTEDGDANEDPQNDPDSDDIESHDEPDDGEDLSDGATDDDTNDDEQDDEQETDDDPDDDEEAELHTMLGVSEDQLTVTDDGEFLLNVKVDGKTSKHKLQEVIKNFQLDKNNTQKSETLSREREAFEARAREEVAKINKTLEHNQALTGVLKKELMAEYAAVDWDALRVHDPAEYAAKRQDYATKYNKVLRLETDLGNQAQELTKDQMNKVKENQQAVMQTEYKKMLKNNPTWIDKETLNKDMESIKTFCKDTYGFSDADFKNVSDSRLIEVLKDAKAYRAGASFKTKKVKKKLPKFQKKVGGGKRKPKVTKLQKLTNAASRAKGANKRDLQTAAVAELLNGG